jgi:hypothetical protein
MSTSRRAKVAAVVKSIREFYEIGRSVPAQRPHREVYGEGIIQEEALRRGMNPDTVGKARAFADRVNGYTPAELDDLCRLVREVQPGQDESLAVFTRTHVIRLLSVPKRFRSGIQQKAIANGWSTAELERNIASLFGTRATGGRRRRVPKDVLGKLVQAEGMCETWARWATAVRRQRAAPASRSRPPADVPPHVQQLVDAATAAIESLHREVLAELAKLRSSRVPRRRFSEEGVEKPKRPRLRA